MSNETHSERVKQLRAFAYKLYDKVMELENGEGGCSLYDYTIDVNSETGFDESKIDNLLLPIQEMLAEHAETHSEKGLREALVLSLRTAEIMVYYCGHPRGGCPSHCDPLVKVIDSAREALAATLAVREPRPKRPKATYPSATTDWGEESAPSSAGPTPETLGMQMSADELDNVTPQEMPPGQSQATHEQVCPCCSDGPLHDKVVVHCMFCEQRPSSAGEAAPAMHPNTVSELIADWRSSPDNNDDAALASRINYAIMSGWLPFTAPAATEKGEGK